MWRHVRSAHADVYSQLDKSAAGQHSSAAQDQMSEATNVEQDSSQYQRSIIGGNSQWGFDL